MSTSYTARLRPLSERTANGVAETKGYNGAAIAPFRTQKPQTKRVATVKGKKVWVNDGTSAIAKGLGADTKPVDNNGDKMNDAPATKSVYRPEALPRLESATPWQDQVKDTAIIRSRKPTAAAYEADIPVTPQAKPVAYDSEGFYEVDRVEGFQHGTAAERDAALAEQVEAFGKSHWGVKGTTTSRKYQYKQAALDKSLDAAFRPRAAYNQEHLSLSTWENDDTETGLGWIPLTDSLLDQWINEEEVAEAAAHMNSCMDCVTNAVSPRELEALSLKATGISNQQISQAMGVTVNRTKELLKDGRRKARQTCTY